MLMSQQRGETNQHEPGHHSESFRTAQMPRIGVDQEKQKRGMERGKEIVRRVYPAEPIEQGAQPTLGMRSRKGEAKRHDQETNACKENRTRDPRDEHFELPRLAKKNWRHDKEQINRHVRKDHERDERNCSLPGKIENPDVTAPRCNPEAGPVNQEEEQRQSDRSSKRLGAGNGGICFQERTRRATATVNIPHRSISIAHFSKPASRTNSSISAVVRRRMIHRFPSRLRRTRAMNSSCGCQG